MVVNTLRQVSKECYQETKSLYSCFKWLQPVGMALLLFSLPIPFDFLHCPWLRAVLWQVLSYQWILLALCKVLTGLMV